MEVIQKEEFAFSILSQLIDEFNLHPDDYRDWSQKIWDAKTHQEIDNILRQLKYFLLAQLKGIK